MRINQIKMDNYRQYRDMELNFQYDGNRDLHLIICSNGVGKTNILNSITWALYNVEPHLGLKSKGLPLVNINQLEEMDVGDTCIVKVEIMTETEGKKINFLRECKFRKNENRNEPFCLENNLEVCIINEEADADIFENDEASRWVNRFVPEKIREFFFFDGEQLNNYFMTDKGTRIESSIYEISQVKLLNSMNDRLGKTIDDLRREASRNNPNTNKLNKELEESQNNLELIQTDLKKCREQIDKSNSIIKRSNEFLRGQDDINELESDREKLGEKLNRYKGDLNNKKIELKDFIREYSIIVNLKSKIEKNIEMINKKETEGKLPPNIDKNFLDNMLLENECLVCKRELDNSSIIRIRELIEKIEVTSEISHLLMKIKAPLETLIEKKDSFNVKKTRILKNIKEIEDEINELRENINRIDNKLSNYKDKEEIKRTQKERIEHENLLDKNKKREGQLEEREKNAIKRLKIAEDKFNQALLQDEKSKNLRKAKQFAEKANRLVLDIEKELMGEVREKIREITQKYFLEFIWKTESYKKVTLDKNYSMGIEHNLGYECLGTLSAAERALLALSFTIGLHKVSGFEAPLVIDTPIARVSDINRINLAKVIKNISEDKQIILLLTPDEYSVEVNKVLDQFSSTLIKLDAEDEKNITLSEVL